MSNSETVRDYELVDQRHMDVPPSPTEGKTQFRTAIYPRSHLSYEPIGYEDTPDDTELIGRAVDGNRSRGPTRDLGNGTELQSMARQSLWTWTQALLSSLWLTFTIIFALNCSVAKPFAVWLLPSRSEDTLLILNVCSQGTVLLLAALTSGAFETVRWTLASSKRGIPVLSFLGLSRATGLPGVLRLFVGGDRDGYLKIDGQQFWGIQQSYPQ